MAELQLSVVSESESRRQIGAQIAAWEENLERLHCEQFRLRCYMASLQHGELPNPKVDTPIISYCISEWLAAFLFEFSNCKGSVCLCTVGNESIMSKSATARRTLRIEQTIATDSWIVEGLRNSIGKWISFSSRCIRRQCLSFHFHSIDFEESHNLYTCCLTLVYGRHKL